MENFTGFAVTDDEGLKYMINVGSAGQPRDGDWRAAYSIYDDELRTVQIRRVEYDLGTARRKVRAAGWGGT